MRNSNSSCIIEILALSSCRSNFENLWQLSLSPTRLLSTILQHCQAVVFCIWHLLHTCPLEVSSFPWFVGVASSQGIKPSATQTKFPLIEVMQ